MYTKVISDAVGLLGFSKVVRDSKVDAVRLNQSYL